MGYMVTNLLLNSKWGVGFYEMTTQHRLIYEYFRKNNFSPNGGLVLRVKLLRFLNVLNDHPGQPSHASRSIFYHASPQPGVWQAGS